MRISDGSSDVCSSDLLSCADAFCRPFPPCAGSRLAKLPSFIATALGDLPIRAASDCTCQFDLWNCPKGNCRYSEKASFSCDGVQLPSVGNCVLKVSVGIGRAPASGRSEEHTSELQSL